MEITVNLTYVFYILALIVLFFVISRAFKDKLGNNKDIHFKNKDTEITQDIIEKFPDVSTEFMKKSEKMMNIENNQEIFELRKDYNDLINRVSVLEAKLNDGTH